jgi:predicted RNA binding protein YcfA (HicA-like mRNA interferase family)
MKPREITRIVEEDGWYFVRQRGSHRHYRHPTKPGIVTIAGKPNQDLAKTTVASILRQAGIKQERGGKR